MTAVVKILANTVQITANTDLGSARLVRVLNTNANVALLTVSDPISNTQLGTYLVGAGDEVVVQKARAHLLSSNGSATYGVSITSSI